ncbi:MAG: hypothetical protein LUQ50_12195 [Methanospirillum sp.]|uniref:hypothetical protein n=1 Tax=Methanospirillum sp. TaxID=45200 RepID=UPI002374503B|nr:hypothetical protein [Methanospirillum sp.]MDD1729817.1 hypothetical protein [Methanospirillum sp.]
MLCVIQPGAATIFSQDGSVIEGAHLIETMNNMSNISDNPFPIHFFYNTHCGSCKRAVRYLQNFTLDHPDTTVEYHDLYNNTESFVLFENYKQEFHRQDISYPVIFVGNTGIMDSLDIELYTEILTLWYQNHTPSDLITGFISRITSSMQYQ